MLNIKNFALSLGLLLLLNACSTIAPQPATTNLHHLSWQDRQKQLRVLNAWDIRGSLSITYNNKTDIASFTWQKNQDNYFINLHGPMNLASTNISGDANKVILQQASGKKVMDTSVEELMRHQLGWALPIDNLNYWVRGMPAPGTTAKSLFDNYNHVYSIRQQNWQINYATYSSFSGIDLPTKIYLNSPQLRAKIVIKQWQTNKPL